MTSWLIAALGYMWFWGALLALAAVQQQKGLKPLSKWDWMVCAFWFISTPLVIVILLFERRSK